MIDNLDTVVKNLRKVKNKITKKTNNLFLKNSAKWISNRADQLLEISLTHESGYFHTNIKEWNIIITDNYVKLENNYENSAAVEFGIGVVGKENPHEHASQSYYQYDMRWNTDEQGRWSFYDQNGDFWYKFSGYKGKSFLYNAFMEYLQNKIYIQIYQEAFDKAMKGVVN